MNNLLVKKIISEQCSNCKKIKLYKNALLYEDYSGNKYVAKENKNVLELYNYLNSRGFDYLPRLKYCNDDYYVYDYKKDIKTPYEQKISDLVRLDALLHNKTVYYKDVSIDDTKEMYDNLKQKIENTFSYYDDLITMIETKVYMSPSEYMLARNCSSIFSCLNFCKVKLDEWYEIASKKSKKRVVLLHNNLDVNHIIKSKDESLISWNKATRGIPIYDFINLYKKNYNKYDFNELYNEYKKSFPFLKEEKILMYIILFIPDKIEFQKSEIKSSILVSKLCNYLYLTDKLFMEQEAKNTKEQDNKINK